MAASQFSPQIKNYSSAEELNKIFHFRVSVWEKSEQSDLVNQQLYPNGWSDLLDASASHWVLEDEDQMKAAARMNLFSDLTACPYAIPPHIHLQVKNSPIVFLSRLVVDPACQGKGYSRILIQKRMEMAREQGYNQFFVFARVNPIMRLLEKLHFVSLGEIPVQYHPEQAAHRVHFYWLG